MENKVEKKEKGTVSLVVAIILFFVGLVYVFGMIANSFTEKPIHYTKENIQDYISEAEVVASNTFYVLDAKVANFLEAVDKEMYSELYSILTDNYSKIYSMTTVISNLKRYRSDIFLYNDDKEHEYIGHLVNAYLLDDGNYLVNLDFDNKNFYLIIGNSRKGYSFTLVE